MRELFRSEVHIVENDIFARDALAMYCAKHEDLTVRSECGASDLDKRVAVHPFRDQDSRPQIALVSCDETRAIKATIAWFEEHFEAPVIVVMVSNPTKTNVVASLSPHTRGVLCRCEAGITIGEMLSRCAGGEFVVTPRVLSHLYTQPELLPNIPPTILKMVDPLEHSSESIARTMRMFAAWGMSNEQIAHHFRISPNTIASRLRVGYIELDSSCRREATRELLTSVVAI